MRSNANANSSQDEAILHGCKAIGQFLGLTPRQTLYRVKTGQIPTFRLGHTICARVGAVRDWQQRLEPGGAAS